MVLLRNILLILKFLDQLIWVNPSFFYVWLRTLISVGSCQKSSRWAIYKIVNNKARYNLIDTKYSQMAFQLARWRCSRALFGNPWSNKSEWWPPEGDNPWNLLFSSQISVNERALNSTSGATHLLSSLQVKILKQEVILNKTFLFGGNVLAVR